MAGTERQTKLKLSLKGASGKIRLLQVDAYEGLNEPFSATLDILAQDEIELLPNLGKPATVEYLLDDEHQRYLHGIVVDARYNGLGPNNGHSYKLVLAPLAQYHLQGSNFRIFQNRSVIAIVEEILEHCKIPCKIVAKGGQRVLPYCVQYGESDFAFASRLMEEEGIYYFYTHEPSAHRMIICDEPASHPVLPVGKLLYNPLSDSVAMVDSASRLGGLGGIWVQRWQEHATSGAEARVTLRDFDFKKPGRPREAKYEDKRAHDDDAVEIYRWPGRYYGEDDGKSLSTVLLESRRAQRVRFDGVSRSSAIQVGHMVEMARHPIARHNRRYLVTNCRSFIATEQYRSGSRGGETHVEFGAIPDDVQFRAPIVTPRPQAKGPETAIVTGPKGEEIHVDEFGRIKVQFHWDRQGKFDDKSSCWLRVSQTGGLGNIIIPRIGHEVLIDFIGGNPDRPVVVGRVFNAANMPVYPLPANKTRAVWRTKTHKRNSGQAHPEAVQLDTGMPGANEIRFEDATGTEEFFVHAEKDMNKRIRNSETHHVGRNVEIKVGKNRRESVGVNETITIGNDRTEQVGGNEKVKVKKNRHVEIDIDDNLNVKKNININSGKEITITAKSKITLKVGGTKITLDPVALKTVSTLLDLQSKATAKLSSAKTDVQGKGMLTAKGGIVLIN